MYRLLFNQDLYLRAYAKLYSNAGAPSAEEEAPSDESLADILLALARQDHASDAWHTLPAVIPLAPESLAHMAAELERREPASAPAPGSCADERAVGQFEAPASVGLYRVQNQSSRALRRSRRSQAQAWHQGTSAIT